MGTLVLKRRRKITVLKQGIDEERKRVYMTESFCRTQMLLGEKAMERLAESAVAIFGVGGVGGYVAEALARSGVGRLVLVDGDVVEKSNLNRQIIALTSTLGRPKVTVMCERILDINSCAKVEAIERFITPENLPELDLSGVHYIVDAIDTVSAKLALVRLAQDMQIPIISAMGAGNKLNPMAFQVTDIFKTSGCPLARVMRRELRAQGISSLKVVFSPEQPQKSPDAKEEDKRTPGSVAFVPSVAGLLLAAQVVQDLTQQEQQ